MSWLPDYIKRNMRVLKCFMCSTRIKDGGATIQYGYTENGQHKIGKVIICTKCADDLDKKNVGSEYDESV